MGSERHTSGDADELEDRLTAESLAKGDPADWFERFYRADAVGEVKLAWSAWTRPPAPAGPADLRWLAGFPAHAARPRNSRVAAARHPRGDSHRRRRCLPMVVTAACCYQGHHCEDRE